jgi:hypothetical protein
MPTALDNGQRSTRKLLAAGGGPWVIGRSPLPLPAAPLMGAPRRSRFLPTRWVVEIAMGAEPPQRPRPHPQRRLRDRWRRLPLGLLGLSESTVLCYPGRGAEEQSFPRLAAGGGSRRLRSSSSAPCALCKNPVGPRKKRLARRVSWIGGRARPGAAADGGRPLPACTPPHEMRTLEAGPEATSSRGCRLCCGAPPSPGESFRPRPVPAGVRWPQLVAWRRGSVQLTPYAHRPRQRPAQPPEAPRQRRPPTHPGTPARLALAAWRPLLGLVGNRAIAAAFGVRGQTQNDHFSSLVGRAGRFRRFELLAIDALNAEVASNVNLEGLLIRERRGRRTRSCPSWGRGIPAARGQESDQKHGQDARRHLSGVIITRHCWAARPHRRFGSAAPPPPPFRKRYGSLSAGRSPQPRGGFRDGRRGIRCATPSASSRETGR